MKIYKYLSFVILFVLYGCSPKYYLPTKQNVMIFEEKGDVIATANIATRNTIGIEAGYAFTNNLGIYSSFNSFSITKYRTNNDNLLKDFIWDNELVCFKKYKNNFYTGLNLGYGMGKLNNKNSFYDLSLQRQFVQPSIGVTIFDNIQLAFSMRASRLDYDLNLNQQFNNQYDKEMALKYFMFDNISNNQIFYFLEPAFTLGTNFEFVNLKFQCAFVSEINLRSYFYSVATLSSSVSLNLDKLFFNPYDKTKKLKWKL